MAPRVEEPVATEPLANPSASKEEVVEEQEPVVDDKVETAPEAAPVKEDEETTPAPEETISSSPTACFDFSFMECCGLGKMGDCTHCKEPVLSSQPHVEAKNAEGVQTYLHQECEEKLAKGATKIQSQIRGNMARKEVAETKKEQAELEAERKAALEKEEADKAAAEEAKKSAKKQGFFAKLFGGCKGKTTSAV